MNYLDLLYRALIDYRKNTLESRECKTQRKAIISADNENDIIQITRKNCIVEEDWIEAIETGLVFVEKAIKEERQFIRSNGEVVPIEKVKRTSKDSVEHLARHSNLFTREPEEGEDLIPDQLYTVERLSDYAVYENRFLYMLLCYLRDFIGMRYEKIVEMTNTYKGNMSMHKDIVESNRKISYEIRLEEERKNDDYLREHNSAQAAIDRILTIYKAVTIYLSTPLMVEVAKAPMLKPPITRTNVLKMNQNFRGAMKLYEFIAAYDRDGYEIKTETKTVSPFVGTVGDEIAESVELSLFLTYEHGLGIKDYFKENYEREEERRRRAEAKKLAEQIRNISRQIKESGLSPEEYISLLERRIRDLEKESEELVVARKLIESMQAEIDHFKTELLHSQDTVRSLGEEIARLNQKYVDDMNAAELAHLEHIREINAEHEQRMIEMQDEHAASIAALNEAHMDEVNAMQMLHTEEVDALKGQIQEIERQRADESERYRTELLAAKEEFTDRIKVINAEHDENTRKLNAQIASNVERINEINAQYAKLEERKTLAEARLNAMRFEYGLMTAKDDFSSREKTDEIEHQYNVFRKFFKTEWKKTKQKIRSQVFTEAKAKEQAEKEAKKSGGVAYPQSPAQIPQPPQQWQQPQEMQQPPQQAEIQPQQPSEAGIENEHEKQ